MNKPDNYTDREPAEELDLISRIHGRFKGTGLIMPESQRKMYKSLTKLFIEEVKSYRGFPKIIHKPMVADIGCGCGIGSNILSQEAQFVWGIDNNKESVEYAKQMFSRLPNNIYYTPQLTFDVIDVLSEPRGLMEFDYVVCIELIEHLPREKAVDLLKFLNRLVKKDKKGNYLENEMRTKIFISTPNRNNENIQDLTPKNEHHCYEPTASEAYEFFTKHYRAVTVYNAEMKPQELNTKETPLVYKLEYPI